MKKAMEIAPIFDNENGEVKISGRQLHMFLEVQTPYWKWFPRMCEYGFTEGIDFNTDKNVLVQNEGGREVRREITDHLMTLSMAKELAMLERTDKGKEARLYFIRGVFVRFGDSFARFGECLTNKMPQSRAAYVVRHCKVDCVICEVGGMTL